MEGDGFSVIRVVFPTDRFSKKLKLDLSTTASQAKQDIWKKRTAIPLHRNTTLADYGLFLPPALNLPGEWMKEEDPLYTYDVEQRGCIEFKLKLMPLTILNPKGTPPEAEFEIDFSVPVANIVPKFVKHFNLPYPGDAYDYYLFKENVEEPLDKKKSLLEQDVPFKSSLSIMKRFKLSLKDSKNAINKSIQVASKFFSQTKEWMSKKGGSMLAEPSNKVFGVPMKEVLARGNHKIVPLVQHCIDYIEHHALDTEGIFRLSGSASEIAALKKQYDDGEDVNLEAKVKDPNVVCGLLKLYLRELPEPLLTWSFYEPFIAAQACMDTKAQQRYYRALILELPKENQFLLQKLLQFMREIVEHQHSNKMAVHNVATVFAPNLLRHQGDSVLVEDTAATNSVICTLINDSDSLFQGIQEFCGVAKSIYEYASDKEHELSFQTDKIIFIVREDESGWWTGDFNGKVGLFPNNYVELITQFKQTPQTKPTETSSPPSHAPFVSTTATNTTMNTTRTTMDSIPAKRTQPQPHQLVHSASEDGVQRTNPKGSGMSKSKFNAELEALKKCYEEEKAARIALEKLATSLSQTVNELKSQVQELLQANQQLQQKARNFYYDD